VALPDFEAEDGGAIGAGGAILRGDEDAADGRSGGPAARALVEQLFDAVIRGSGPPTPIRNLATTLQTQVSERLRSTREEQQKSEQAVRKLDQMLELERALLRDRVRSGGGGGGGGGGGSAGGH